jgi:hypothetical protein
MNTAATREDVLGALDIGGIRPPFSPPSPPPIAPTWYVAWSVRSISNHPQLFFSRALPSIQHPVHDTAVVTAAVILATPGTELVDLQDARACGDKLVTDVTDACAQGVRRTPMYLYGCDSDALENQMEAHWEHTVSLPTAPLLRDFDSFTDRNHRTTVGSFDFSLPPDSPRIPYRQLEPDDASLLRSEHFAPYSIETWRKDVVLSAGHDEAYQIESRDTSRGIKRHRSFPFLGDVDQGDAYKRPHTRWLCRSDCQYVGFRRCFSGMQGRCACMTRAS